MSRQYDASANRRWRRRGSALRYTLWWMMFTPIGTLCGGRRGEHRYGIHYAHITLPMRRSMRREKMRKHTARTVAMYAQYLSTCWAQVM